NFDPKEYIESLCSSQYTLAGNEQEKNNDNILFAVKEVLSDKLTDFKYQKSQAYDEIKKIETNITNYNLQNSDGFHSLISKNNECSELYEASSNLYSNLNRDFFEIQEQINNSTVEISRYEKALRCLKIVDYLRKNQLKPSGFDKEKIEDIIKQLDCDISQFAKDIAYLAENRSIFSESSLISFKASIDIIQSACSELLNGDNIIHYFLLIVYCLIFTQN
ncbi:MAG: hypothetical protein MHPSP_001742, partial [Paramarteilia canceri]